MKYSKSFERDYNFYLTNINNFNFCGTGVPGFLAEHGDMPTKEAFFRIDSGQKIYAIEKRLNALNMTEDTRVVMCDDPELFMAILLCKSGVNFQIKQWAECLNDGTLPFWELSKRVASDKLPDFDFSDCKTLAWENNEPVYYEDIETQFGLPEWVVKAAFNQAKATKDGRIF